MDGLPSEAVTNQKGMVQEKPLSAADYLAAGLQATGSNGNVVARGR